MGDNSAEVNGTYYFTDKMRNGKPVYAKKGDVDTTIYYTKDGSWIVSDAENGQATRFSGYAYTEMGLATPITAKAWHVMDKADYVAQALKTATMVTF